MNLQIRPGLALGAIVLAIAAVALVNVHATGINSGQWTQIGPAPQQVAAFSPQKFQGSGPNSGEVVDIAIDPRGSADQTIYIASGSGGIWKSTNDGTSWKPLTDSLLTLSTGAVALDPGNPSIVYAGTGNPAFGGDCPGCIFQAVGIYKSSDGGGTWTLLTNSPAGVKVNRIVLPKPGVLLVATTGGLYRSLDAGAHFTQLAVSGSSSDDIKDIHLDTQSPSTTVRVSISRTGARPSLPSGLGIFVSNSDVCAATPPTFTNLWTALNGSPFQNPIVTGGTVGDIAFAQSTMAGGSRSGNTIYATVQNSTASHEYLGLWVSTDDGATWVNLPAAHAAGAGCQCSYDLTIRVDPTTDQTVYIGFQKVWRSTDGGGSFGSTAITLNQVHDDNHAFVFSPHDTTGQTFYTGQDGGIAMTTNGGSTFTNINGSTSFANGGIASNLVRRIDIGRGSNTNRQWTYAGFQDTGNAQFGPGYTGNTWQLTIDGDGGPIAVDPCNPLHAITTDDGGYVQTTDGGNSWSGSTLTLFPAPPAGFTVNANAFAFDQTCDNTVYAAFTFTDPTGTIAPTFGFYQSADNGNNYTRLASPPKDVAAIATVKIDPNVVWVGFDNGSVAYTTNALLGAAATWTALPDPSGATQAALGIAIDPINTDTVFVVYPGISGASPSQHIFKTPDHGGHWADISGTGPDGLPDLPLHAIAIDPATNKTPRTIIVGGDGGVFQTTDDGASWQVLGAGLPTVGVNAVALDSSVSPSLLRIGTYGRSSFEFTPCLSLEPQISVTVSPTQIKEGGNATFTVSMSGSNTDPCNSTTVHYAMSGSAQQGTDYTLSGTPLEVTIPASQNSATVTLHALNNSRKKTVNAIMTLTTLARKPGYTIVPPISASVTISPLKL